MSGVRRWAPVAARVLFSVIVLSSGLAHFGDAVGTADNLASKGLPAPHVLAVAGGLLETICGVAVLLGLGARSAAAVFSVYLVIVTALLHNPAGLTGEASRIELLYMMKNGGLVAGMLMLWAFGPGPLALGNRFAARTPAPPGDPVGRPLQAW